MESNKALAVAGVKNKLVAAIEGLGDWITWKIHDSCC
jgi:hypothetical protein